MGKLTETQIEKGRFNEGAGQCICPPADKRIVAAPTILLSDGTQTLALSNIMYLQLFCKHKTQELD
jgi:hypothetical protein